MKILVFVRQVLSAGELVAIDGTSNRVDDSRAKFQPHPLDEAMVEAAVRLKETASGDAAITVVAIGPERTEADLRSYLAVGADEAIRVWDELISGVRLDDGAVARFLADLAVRLSPDWIFCGDDSSTSVAGFLAELLQLPAATAVRSVEPDGKTLRVKRKFEKSTATVAIAAPGILAMERGPAPRYPSHRDRLLAKRKSLPVLGSTDVPKSMEAIAAESSVMEIEAITLPKPGKKNYPPAEDGFSRYVGLLLGGVAGDDAGGQVIDDSTDRMADAAVAKIESLGCL